jgi:hypothetical protein
MNDQQIRTSFFRKWLSRHRANSQTLIINELGLNHGKNRADIAVINGRLTGYEIKSDADSLRRLDEQISSYNEIFDRIYLISTKRHLFEVIEKLPDWWGIIIASEGKLGAINFILYRKTKKNPNVDNHAVARLLWRPEAQDILNNQGAQGNQIRLNRELLYNNIISIMNPTILRRTVRNYLRKRKNWRDHSILSLDDD